MRGIDAEDRHFGGEEGEFLKREFQAAIVGVAVDVRKKLRRRELAFQHVAFELRHVDAVGGETAERLVERRRYVPHAKHEAGDDGAVAGRRALRLARQDDEPRRVVGGILDVLGEDIEAVDVGGQSGRERRARRIVPFRHLPRRAGRIARDMGRQSMPADDVAALSQRVDMAVHIRQPLQCRALRRHELEADRQEIFADDMQAGGGEEMVDVGDAAGERVLDRDHAERGDAVGDRGQRVLEAGAGQRLHIGIDVAAGDMGVGAGLSLVGDLHSVFPFREPVACFGKVGGRIYAAMSLRDQCGIDAHPVVHRAQLFKPLARFVVRRRQGDEPFERGAPVRIDPDMPPRRTGRGPERQRARKPRRPDTQRAQGRAEEFHGIGVGAIGVEKRRGERGDGDGGIVERTEHGAQRRRIGLRFVALQVDDHVVTPLRIDRRHGLGDPVRPCGMVPRQDRTRPCLARRAGDRRIIGRDENRAEAGLQRTRDDMGDHRPARDIGEGLAGQPRGLHAGRDDEDRTGWHVARRRSFGPAASGRGIDVANRRAKQLILP